MDIQWYPGHMAKTRKMIKQNLPLIDVVVELVDARAPWSTHLPDIRDLIGNKNLVVVLNKSDLADKAVTALWVREFNAIDIPAVAVNSMQRKGLNDLVKAIKKTSGKGLTRCMVLGVPNVGKSFLINQLAGRKGAKTGDRPGVTRGKMWLKAGYGLEMLDTPGVLWPKFEKKAVGVKLGLIGSIKQELLMVEELVTLLIEFLNRRYPQSLSTRYKIDEGLSPRTTLEQVAKKRGFFESGGVLDIERSAKTIFDEFRQGRLGPISLETPGDVDLWDDVLGEN
jgi:ribosome biogenesis GTPase A